MSVNFSSFAQIEQAFLFIKTLMLQFSVAGVTLYDWVQGIITMSFVCMAIAVVLYKFGIIGGD